MSGAEVRVFDAPPPLAKRRRRARPGVEVFTAEPAADEPAKQPRKRTRKRPGGDS